MKTVFYDTVVSGPNKQSAFPAFFLSLFIYRHFPLAKIFIARCKWLQDKNHLAGIILILK